MAPISSHSLIPTLIDFRLFLLARMDRYNHDLGGDDTDETEDSPLIGSFGSYSPHYRRQNSSRFPNSVLSDKTGTSMSPNNSLCDVKLFTRPELRKLDASISQMIIILILIFNRNISDSNQL